MEEMYAVEPIGIKYICDTCGKGEMFSTGKNDWTINPPQFEHLCSNCSQKEFLKEKYPLVRFRRV